MTFEETLPLLSAPRKQQLACCVRDNIPLPQPLTDTERAFCFGLSLFLAYDDPAGLDEYCNIDEA